MNKLHGNGLWKWVAGLLAAVIVSAGLASWRTGAGSTANADDIDANASAIVENASAIVDVEKVLIAMQKDIETIGRDLKTLLGRSP